jgi:hypothetical protein
MAEVPTFFFSYARQDREAPGKYLRCFFDDLEKRLASWVGHSLEGKRLGTMDARIRQGNNWDADLSRGLESNKAFVAIITPLYFNRPNCGKELGTFLLRSPGLDIDVNGALKNARNLLLIRWLPERAYTVNTIKDSLIPPILRLIEDTPADDGDDDERTKSIEKYRRKGMERCVTSHPEYDELLDLFVESIRDMPELPSASNVSFATAIDAFNFDWKSRSSSGGGPAALPSTAALSVPPVMPRPLASVVVFYITRRPFTPDPIAVEFADSLIAEALPGQTASGGATFDALLADVRAAGVAEGLTVFHAASNPVIPISPDPVLARLVSLSASGVLTALIVDSSVWPGAVADAGAGAVEQIIRSPEWSGPVLLSMEDARSVNEARVVDEPSWQQRLVMLPPESEKRVTTLRRVFIANRGFLLRMKTNPKSDAEPVPILKGAIGERE